MDEYEDDSFVVANSVVEYETSLDELDMVDEFESDEEVARKTRFVTKKTGKKGSSLQRIPNLFSALAPLNTKKRKLAYPFVRC